MRVIAHGSAAPHCAAGKAAYLQQVLRGVAEELYNVLLRAARQYKIRALIRQCVLSVCELVMLLQTFDRSCGTLLPEELYDALLCARREQKAGRHMGSSGSVYFVCALAVLLPTMQTRGALLQGCAMCYACKPGQAMAMIAAGAAAGQEQSGCGCRANRASGASGSSLGCMPCRRG